MPINEAKRQGAIGEFGQKYGEQVRVVTIGDYFKELCGGTHVGNTAQLGLVKLLRRVEHRLPARAGSKPSWVSTPTTSSPVSTRSSPSSRSSSRAARRSCRRRSPPCSAS
ncbi:hypothetical protein STANM309S_03767 [Streptomyces tanashiensis]